MTWMIWGTSILITAHTYNIAIKDNQSVYRPRLQSVRLILARLFSNKKSQNPSEDLQEFQNGSDIVASCRVARCCPSFSVAVAAQRIGAVTASRKSHRSVRRKKKRCNTKSILWEIRIQYKFFNQWTVRLMPWFQQWDPKVGSLGSENCMKLPARPQQYQLIIKS